TLAILFVHEPEEGFRRPLELTERHAEDAVGLGRPAQRVRVGELGDPAADVRDFLRLLEKRAMLFDRFGCAYRFADVAEAREAPEDDRVDTVRRRVALV